MEQREYSLAKKSFRRALRMLERAEEEEHNSNSNLDNLSSWLKELSGLSLSPSEQERRPTSPALTALSDSSSSSGSSDFDEEDEPGVPLHSPTCAAEYDEGMDYFKNPVLMNSSTKTAPGPIVLFNLARVHHNQGLHKEALSLYKRAHCEYEGRLNDSLKLCILSGMGHCLYTRGDHSLALEAYEAALQVTKADSESLAFAACLNCTGVLNYIMPTGDSMEALKALQKSLGIRRSILGNVHAHVGTSWNNIGRIHFQQGSFEPAIAAYRQALHIRQTVAQASVDVAATLFNIGQVYHQSGDRESALQYYQEFLKLAKLHFGEYHRDVCIVTTCIGQVHHETKEYKKAMRAFHEALKVGRLALGSVHAEIAITLNKLGNLYYETGDLDSALKAYHQGLKVELAVLEAGNPNVCITYTNIAEIHKQRSELNLALTNYDRVLELQRKYGAAPPDLANTLSCIGYIRHQKGDYSGAMEANQECLQIRRECKGDTDEDVASTLTHIALVLLKMDMHDMALEVLSEAYRIRVNISKSTNTECRDVAFTLYNIAIIHHHQGNHEQALLYYLETARVEKATLGQAHRDLSITYYNIGQIYYQRGEMELAVTNFREALKIERECFGVNHPTCARTLNEIGNIQLQLGNIEDVMKCYTESLRIYRMAGLPDDHLVIYGTSLWRLELVHPSAAPVA